MTDPQENKLTMYLTVQKVCDQNHSVWGAIPAFETALNQFKDLIQQIKDTIKVQTEQITGHAKDKQECKHNLINKSVQVALGVYSYAKAINNETLADSMNYKPAKLSSIRDSLLPEICAGIHERANEIIAELNDYGITATVLTDLEDCINAFNQQVVSPREAIGTRAEATAKLKELFKSADNILKGRLDTLAFQFEITSPKFYKKYKNARTIIDLGHRHKPATPTLEND